MNSESVHLHQLQQVWKSVSVSLSVSRVHLCTYRYTSRVNTEDRCHVSCKAVPHLPFQFFCFFVFWLAVTGSVPMEGMAQDSKWASTPRSYQAEEYQGFWLRHIGSDGAARGCCTNQLEVLNPSRHQFTCALKPTTRYKLCCNCSHFYLSFYLSYI